MANTSISALLLQIGAVQVNPKELFTWTSGLKSPIYCDNRMTMSHPDVRKQIIDKMVDHIQQLPKRVDMIAGCATAGIPHAAWVADRLNLPMVYVRSEAKKHGKGNQIEGDLTQGENVVVIEDLISTGKSSIASSDALRESGKHVIEVLSIFSYNLTAANKAFEEKDYAYDSLADYNELITLMKDKNELTEEDYRKLKEWSKQPDMFTKS
ncbi:orotate phosphoribosyltransferase [Halobacillus andaensis]|uniref:Orotate phosphoribosyltransferase n=1 Tax=Halobacillus andaensis TaxID=1176239 RepID=A0A917B096_HALAA|nr:orotate phosphoribosyltransferase [Halobacillus andaensis]MBP2003553.1 orotate phosphoribosyltransferase [Halobacillus andaensis]GGF11506.1 orotate phosphoribosyltransferase [Halobacillus andaensis]